METNELNLPPDVLSAAEKAKDEAMPIKSKPKYEQAYSALQKWTLLKNIPQGNFDETVLLAYFHELSEKMAPTSLWSIWSMLKSTINRNHKIDIGKYNNLIAFIKSKNKGYISKKASVFSESQINQFINEAPDLVYLADKVITIFGLMGACRTDELKNIRLQDIERHGSLFLVKIPKTKTCLPRSFTISDDYFKIVQKYKSLRPLNVATDAFFLNYQKGACTVQVIGKNKLTKTPCRIAEYLKLENPKNYTGHSFRRTSASVLANNGADMLTIKSHGGWKSATVAEGYIENSLLKKKTTENIITAAIGKSSGGNENFLSNPNAVNSAQTFTSEEETFYLNEANEALVYAEEPPNLPQINEPSFLEEMITLEESIPLEDVIPLEDGDSIALDLPVAHELKNQAYQEITFPNAEVEKSDQATDFFKNCTFNNCKIYFNSNK